MKFYKRFLLLSVCLALSLVAFSPVANAEEIETNYDIIEKSYYNYGTGWFYFDYDFQFNSYDGTQTKSNGWLSNIAHVIANNPKMGFQQTYQVVSNNGKPLFSGDDDVTIKFDNIYYSYLLGQTGNYEYLRTPTSVSIEVFYTDNSVDVIYDATFEKVASSEINISFSFTPKMSVSAISFNLFNEKQIIGSKYTDFSIEYYLGEWNGDGKYVFTVDKATKQEGLLKNIWGSLSDGFSNLAKKLGDLLNGILELPTKILDGLKSLFIPREGFFQEKTEENKILIKERLGALYQVVELSTSRWEEIDIADTQNTIYFPATEIPLPENNNFSFGGYEVQIVPSGFEGIVDSCKIIVSIVSTLFFVNGLRKRYDEVMGVER